MPHLQHQQRQDLLDVYEFACRHGRTGEGLNGIGIEVTASLQVLGLQCFPDEFPEYGRIEIPIGRYGKCSLPSLGNVRRQTPRGVPSRQDLVLAERTVELQALRYRQEEFDEDVVQERNACLDGVRHGHLVLALEDVVGEPRSILQQERMLEESAARILRAVVDDRSNAAQGSVGPRELLLIRLVEQADEESVLRSDRVGGCESQVAPHPASALITEVRGVVEESIEEPHRQSLRERRGDMRQSPCRRDGADAMREIQNTVEEIAG